MQYRRLKLRLKGQLTLAAANNTAALTKRGDEWAVVKKIEIIANGTDVVKTIPGTELRWMNPIWNNTMPNVTAALADGVTVDVPFDSTLIFAVSDAGQYQAHRYSP